MRYLLLVSLLTTAVFAACAIVVCAQEPAKKPSYSKLKSESAQAETMTLLNEAHALKNTSPKRALELVKEALAISILQQDVVAEARCYNLLGEINMNFQEWKLAKENFSLALEKLAGRKAMSSAEGIVALQGLARVNLKLGDFAGALHHLEEIRKSRADAFVMIETELDVSEAYYQMGNYTEAMNALDRIGRFRKALDRSLEGRVENQKAKILARTDQVDESYKNFLSSQSKLRSSRGAEARKQDEEIRTAKEEITGALQEQKRYDEKITLLNSSIDFNIDVENLGEVSTDKAELGRTLLAKGETSSAIRELQEAALIADTIGDPHRQASAYLSLAELYQNHSRPFEALDTYRKYSQAVSRSESRNVQILTEKSELIKTQRDIEELSKYITVSKQEEQLAQAMVVRQKLVIYGLILIIVIIGVTSYFIHRNAVASKTANQLLALKSLRSQMNPHFIFNALNSVNHFVSRNDERTANKFLSEFSRLMRLVLEHSQEDFISLQKEEEIISLYLKLEHYRFRDKFDYEILIDEAINKEAVEIPPMLIQPYIENAVWHGLRYRETRGFLSVKINLRSHEVCVEISDNGIGRRKSAELKTENQKKHQSTGLKNIRERLSIINNVYRRNYQVEIDDLPGDSGTRVTLFVPINAKESRDA
jgi:tetratricopeptide (TPR) repeat protein